MRPAAYHLMIGACGLGIKFHYSRADGVDLGWILGPTAAVTGWMSGIAFSPAGAQGYLSRDMAFLIAPSCAGVNFLIIAFVMAGCMGAGRFRRVAQFRQAGRAGRFRGAALPFGWMALAALSAYGLTVGVNALRILASIHLYGMDIYGGWLTPERLHRMAGVIIYLTALCAYHAVLERAMTARGRPLLIYLAVTLGVPMANSAIAGNPSRFYEHAAVALGGCGAIFLLTRGLRWGCKGIWKRSVP